jgi:phosphatidylglycerophosphate synthase
MISLSEVKNFKYRINPTEEIEGRGNFGYYVIRPISLYFTWLILQTGMSANQITVLHGIIGTAGAVMLGFADDTWRFVGLALLYFSYVLDNVDGEVARFKKQVSISGKYLDSVMHAIVNMVIFFGFGFGVFLQTGRVEMVVLGFLAGFFSQRFDVYAMYTEAAQSAFAHLDSNYDYYSKLEDRLNDKEELQLQHISKTAGSPLKRLIFAVFAYPGTLNVITILIFFEFFMKMATDNFPPAILSMLALYFYGILLPLRRVVTIRKIASNLETERLYLKLRKLK